MMTTAKDQKDHWLSASVSLWQLLAACLAVVVTIITTIGSSVITNESRVSKIETAQVYGGKRNDAQDQALEALRNTASSNQVAIGQINARLDGIYGQLANISIAVRAEQHEPQPEGRRR